MRIILGEKISGKGILNLNDATNNRNVRAVPVQMSITVPESLTKPPAEDIKKMTARHKKEMRELQKSKRRG